MASITAIICTYNECRTVAKCIKSIFAADSRINEIIVVDDCSKDKTRENVRKLNDPRVKFYRKNHAKYYRGKNDSLYMGAHLASNELIIGIDCDTIANDLSDLINKLEAGYDLVGAIIAVIPTESVLSKCEALEYDIAIRRTRAWLFDKFNYLNNVSGACFGITRTKLNENHIPASVTGEDMYLTQVGLIQGWKIALSTSVISTYATPNVHALFIQRCRWVNGYYSIIKATGRKTPLIEMVTIYYRTIVTGVWILTGMQFTEHFWLLTFFVLSLYYLNELYRTKNPISALQMMVYRQINFASALLYFKYGKVW